MEQVEGRRSRGVEIDCDILISHRLSHFTSLKQK